MVRALKPDYEFFSYAYYIVTAKNLHRKFSSASIYSCRCAADHPRVKWAASQAVLFSTPSETVAGCIALARSPVATDRVSVRVIVFLGNK